MDVRIRAYDRAARKLQRANEGGRCGEREAARALVTGAYASGLDDAIAEHDRKSPAPDDLAGGLEFDARRYAVLERRVRELAVSHELQTLHDRFYATVKRSARLYRRWADGVSPYSSAESDRLDAVRDRAAKRLHRRVKKIL